MSQNKSVEEPSLSEIEEELQARSSAKAGAKSMAPMATAAGHISTDALIAQLLVQQKAIYDVDDRKDYFEFPNSDIRNSAASVAALFKANAITNNGDGTYALTTQKFGDKKNLCAREKFRNQPAGAWCSGFLVAPDIIATAGHCVTEGNVSTMHFVFGFRMTDADTPMVTIPAAEVYIGKELFAHALVLNGPDWALVRLDRAVVGRPIVKLRREGRVADNAPMYVIGHPSGLPIKFADGAIVRDNTPSSFFVANLDAYGGNSGSPVFGPGHVVEGVLVRGEADFVYKDGCNVSKVCPSSGCSGESCTRTTEFADRVPE